MPGPSTGDVAGAAATGAATGAAGGPLGMALGAGIGMIKSMTGGKKSGKRRPKTPYDPTKGPGMVGFTGQNIDPRSLVDPTDQRWQRWKAEGKIARPGTGDVAAARGLQAGARGSQQDALGLMRQWATGEESVSRRQTASAVDRLKAAMMAQSQTGQFQPGARRQALYQGGQLGADVAGAAGINAAMEQQAATEAMMKGASAMRGQDIGLMGAETDWWSRQMGANISEAQLQQNYMQMGMSQREAYLAAQRQLAMMAMQSNLSERGIDLGYAGLDLQRDKMQQEQQNRMIAGFTNLASQGLGYLSGRSGGGGGDTGGGGGRGSDVGGGLGPASPFKWD